MSELTPAFDVSTAMGQIKWRRRTAKKDRNAQIFMDKSAGATYLELSRHYNISRARACQIVQRIRQAHREQPEAE